MLIEFSVTNFRSFRERQTLSMVAASRLRKRENVFVPKVQGEQFPALLKACVIYGPNASGKSNLLRALNVVPIIAARQPSNNPRPLPVAPFRFDRALADKPSSFEIHFIHNEQRYQFVLEATSERIWSEQLTAFPRGEEVCLYARTFSDGREHYEFSADLEGGDDLHEAWRKLTAPNVLFISQAVANSSEDLKQLRHPLNWLTEAVFPVLSGMQTLSRASQRLASDSETHAKAIADFLQTVDVPISKMHAERIPVPEGALASMASLADASPRPGLKQERFKTTFTHSTALGEGDLNFEDESEGTKNLVGFWLPWTTKEMSALPGAEDARCVLAVDELDSSLHPKIVVALVAKHLQSTVPTQLIFTTHDTHLMDAKLLRRDQIWVTERDANGATQLRSIHEFAGRESEDIEKRYYEGRYRALPLFKGL